MPRLFTIQKVKAILPEVRKLTYEIVGISRKVARAQGTEKDDLLRTATDLVRKLENLGCELKSPELGLVDFPAIRGGHPAYLCWRLGEETVSFWHSPNGGFAGRKTLDESDFLGELEPIALDATLISILVQVFEKYGNENHIIKSNVATKVLRASQLGESTLSLEEADIKMILALVNRFLDVCKEVDVKPTMKLREILIQALM